MEADGRVRVDKHGDYWGIQRIKKQFCKITVLRSLRLKSIQRNSNPRRVVLQLILALLTDYECIFIQTLLRPVKRPI